MYSFSGNGAASFPKFHIHVSVSDICMFPGSVHIFPPAEKADPSWEYIIRSQTHECGNWDWDPDIPFLGIFVQIFDILSLQCSIESGPHFFFCRLIGFPPPSSYHSILSTALLVFLLSVLHIKNSLPTVADRIRGVGAMRRQQKKCGPLLNYYIYFKYARIRLYNTVTLQKWAS